MAVDLHERDSSLPPQLLNDEVSASENRKFTPTESDTGSSFNRFSPVGSSWSGLSSPFGSELGSTETESEEEEDGDDFMAELTRRMADYTLGEDDDYAVIDCGPTHSKAYKAENQPSIESHVKVEETDGGEAKRTESTQQLERKKPRQLQHRSNGVMGSPPAAWAQLRPPLPADYGSGMRAVFLRGPAATTKTGGTGVFLPRGAGNPPAIRKKIGCSTVLIPARVLYALQLHFQNASNRSQSNDCASIRHYLLQHDTAAAQTQCQYPLQKPRSQPKTDSSKNAQEIGLPQEWIY